jgi:hypothetical protein
MPDIEENKPLGDALRELVNWIKGQITSGAVDRAEYTPHYRTANAFRIDAERFEAAITPEGAVEMPLLIGRRLISKKDEGRIPLANPERKLYTVLPSPHMQQILKANHTQSPDEVSLEPYDPERELFRNRRESNHQKDRPPEYNPNGDPLANLAQMVGERYSVPLSNQIIAFANLLQAVMDQQPKRKR